MPGTDRWSTRTGQSDGRGMRASQTAHFASSRAATSVSCLGLVFYLTAGERQFIHARRCTGRPPSDAASGSRLMRDSPVLVRVRARTV